MVVCSIEWCIQHFEWWGPTNYREKSISYRSTHQMKHPFEIIPLYHIYVVHEMDISYLNLVISIDVSNAAGFR